MRTFVNTVLVAALALLAAAPGAAAATFYVNNGSTSCSNSGPGTQAQPFCTISAALSAQHAPGTTIVVMPGTYAEQVNVPSSGTSGSPITLQAQGTPTNPVVIDGGTTRSFGVNIAGCSWIVVDGFTTTRTVWADIYVTGKSSNVTITHNTATAGNTYGIQVDNSTAVLVASNVAHDNLWSGIALTGGSTGCTIQDNESYHNLTPNQSSGIYDYGSPSNLIQRNRVHDNAYNGIMNTTGAVGNLLRQNRSWNNQHQGIEDIFCTGNYHVGDVSFNNGWNGFAIEGGATGTSVYDCVSFNNNTSNGGNTNFEIDAASTSGLAASDNLWWNTSGGTIILYGGNAYTTVSAFRSATGLDQRTLQADPKFVNAAAGDFRPAAGSPLIDSGNSGVANWPSTDAVGNARVDDPATPNTGIGSITYADRGALEFQTSGSTNKPPVAALKLTPTSGILPLAVSANASGSTDPEGGRIASYRFDFGDGAVVGPQTGATATHTYNALGIWLVTVTVTDSVGATGTATAPDTVRSIPPTAKIALSPTSGAAPLPVTANASASTRGSSKIVSYRFDFGDGTVVGPQAGATATHTYNTGGTWIASVLVTDSLGVTGTASAPDTVRGGPPVAVLKVTPSSGFAPLAVIADGSGSTGSSKIVSYSFNFGDGTPVVSQTSKTAAHTYAAGNWTASLTVTDSLGATGSTTTLVNVASGTPPPTGTFYVDGSNASCSPTGPGTQAAPFCTITAALAAQHAPGTTIIVMPGVYREQVTLPASGTSVGPIVLQAQSFPGSPVVISGADDLSNASLWALSSGTVWLAASVNWSPLQVLADSVRLAASTVAPASLPTGSFEYVAGQGLYVNLGGDSPALHHAEASHRAYGVTGSGRSWVTIDGFTITRCEQDNVVLQNASSNCAVTHNTLTFGGAYGIQVDNSSGVLVGSNVVSNNLSSGIGITGGSTGCTVQDNESFRNVTPSQSAGIYLYGSTANLIQRNRVHDNAYTGVKLIGASVNNVLLQNRSWNNAHHGFQDVSSAGNAHVGDVAWGNASYGFAIESSATGTTLYDCVATDNSGGSDLEVDATSITGFLSNDNLFWNTAGGTIVKYNGTSFTTVAAYSGASTQDTRTLQANPKFVNAASGDFRPAAGSPLIDSGNSGVPNWPSTDAAGNARADDPATPNTGLGPVPFADRGALEFQPSGGTVNQPPVAKIVLSPTSGFAPLAVTANASGSTDPEGGRIASYRFDFGDGTVVGPQPGATATHTYSAPGRWLANVTVTDSLGATGTASAPDTVRTGPTAALKLTPTSGTAPLPVNADASGSTAGSSRIVSYRFDFGDGTVVGPQAGATASHTYGAAGRWLASVLVTDSLGATSTASAPDTVRSTGPTAALKLTPTSGTVPLPVNADASGSIAGSSRIVSYRFDFGDGTVVGPQAGATASHTYGAAGRWLASVLVTDSLGATSTASAPDTVRNAGPTAALKLTPTSGTVPLPVNADASGSIAGSSRIVSYRFDFGDGTVVGPQAGATATHTYGTPGIWLASVLVTDSLGTSGTASAPDTVRAGPPVAVLKVTPSTGVAPLAVIADGSGSTGASKIVSYSFNFGDGTPVVSQPGKTAAHTYAAGNWTASLTVTDSLGATGSTTTPVTVSPAPPPPTGTFYVDGSNASCSPTGPGTQTAPFCTITAALTAQHAPGTTIIVMPGVYREQITLPASGASGSPITLQAQGTPGNPVVVSGSDDLSNASLWALSSGTVWLAASVNWSPKEVLADSVRLAASTVAPASLPTGSFEYVAGQGLYVNLGGDSPALHHAEASHRAYGFYASARTWVVIDGFTVTRCEQANVELTSLANNCALTHSAVTFGGAYGIQVNNCSAVLVGSNVVSDNLSSGIGITGGSTGCTIQDNETFRNITPSQSCGIYDYGSPGNLFQRNRAHDNAYTGVKMVGAAINNVLLQNRSWKNGHYGFQDVSSAGNAHVGDVAWGNTAYGFAIESSATGTSMYDCVATDNGGGSDLEVDASSITGWASNDNLFWNTAGGTIVKYNGTSYTTIAAYSGASTQDTRTLQADPKFVNATGADFRPATGSPLIDSGNSGVPNWPSTDAAGNARVDDPATPNTGLGPVAFADRGALEYQPGAAVAASLVPTSSLNAGSPRITGLAPAVAPNPVRGSATFSFRLDAPTQVRIRVFDLGGRLVRTLQVAGQTSAGWNVVSLDGRADDGSPLRSGIYMYEIRAGGQRAVGRFVMMR